MNPICKQMSLIAVPLVALLLAGCATSADESRVATMSCQELEGVVSTTAKQISDAAVTRGRVAEIDPPLWLFGASRAKEAVEARQTRKIEEWRSVQAAAVAQRKARCRYF